MTAESTTFEVWTRHIGKSTLRFINSDLDAVEAVALLLMNGGGKWLPHSAYYSDILIKKTNDGMNKLIGKWAWNGPEEDWRITIPIQQEIIDGPKDRPVEPI